MLRINYLKHTASAGYWNQIGKWLYLEIRLKLITASIRNNLRFWGGRLVRNNSAKALNNFTITVVVNVITTWFCIKKCLNFARRAHSAIWDGWNEEKDNGKGHPRKGHEGPEGKKRYSSIFYLTSALDRDGLPTPRLGRLTPPSPGKDPIFVVQEVGWAPGSVWAGGECLAPTTIRSPDRPARSESLYRLSYPGLVTK